MRPIISLLALALLIPLLISPARPAAADENLRSTVSVVGDGRVLVQPDVVLLSFGVETAAPTLDAAQAEAANRMQAVIQTLVAYGVAREDIRTTRLSVNPEYDQRDRTILRGFRVTNNVQAKLRDIDRAGQVIDAVVASGANRVNGVTFSLDNQVPFKDQARALAVANARAKADQLAALVGMSVVGVKSIVESDAVSTPVRAAPAAAPAEAVAAPTPVEPGEQEVRTMVTVVFILG